MKAFGGRGTDTFSHGEKEGLKVLVINRPSLTILTFPFHRSDFRFHTSPHSACMLHMHHVFAVHNLPDIHTHYFERQTRCGP